MITIIRTLSLNSPGYGPDVFLTFTTALFGNTTWTCPPKMVRGIKSVVPAFKNRYCDIMIHIIAGLPLCLIIIL